MALTEERIRERLYRLVAHEDAGWGSADTPLIACSYCCHPYRNGHADSCDVVGGRADLGLPREGLAADEWAQGIARLRLAG